MRLVRSWAVFGCRCRHVQSVRRGVVLGRRVIEYVHLVRSRNVPVGDRLDLVRVLQCGDLQRGHGTNQQLDVHRVRRWEVPSGLGFQHVRVVRIGEDVSPRRIGLRRSAHSPAHGAADGEEHLQPRVLRQRGGLQGVPRGDVPGSWRCCFYFTHFRACLVPTPI